MNNTIMKQIRFRSAMVTLLIVLFLAWTWTASNPAVVLAQQPTDTPASSTGIFITVLFDEPQINVRMGPNSSIYPVVGTMLAGSTAPALGRSQGGDWIQIEFPSAPGGRGWVYSPLVQLSPGELQIAEPPPTPVPPATSTIDPTLAAQFIVVPTSTRLPTFTPPPSLAVPSYTQPSSFYSADSVPLAVIIVALAILGLVGFLLSILRR
jgi:hypothetical protein